MTTGRSSDAGDGNPPGSDARIAELARYVPRIAAGWDDIAGGRQWYEVEGSLCLIDVSGFTSLSERLATRGRIGAEELTDVLGAVFSPMLGTAYAYGGSLIKFGGDALLLLFTGEAHAIRATSAVTAMQATLRRTEFPPTAAGRVKLRMSVGVHSGTIQLFCVGTSHRELMITGPAGTVTTSMERIADPGEIVVSSATRELLPAGATSAPRQSGWRLRWRKPAVAPEGFAGRGDLARHDMRIWMSTGLRSFLTAMSPEPEHRTVTVGFVRFCSVDDVIATEGLEAVAAHLQEMVDVIQAAAEAESVTFLATDINEDGGKVILVAGAPTVHEDDEGRMLRAARRIAEANTRFDLHIGVNRGHVFAGEVGTEYRSTYTVMGDTVNVAARLCGAAWAGKIYATPDVLERSHTRFATTQLDPLTVKGKSEPLLVYDVGEELGFRSAATRTDLPFVGRNEELARLRATLDPKQGETGAVTTVTGEMGTGKSRLVDEALSNRADLRTIALRAEPYGAANPYRPMRDPLRDLIGITRGSQAEMTAMLRDRISAVDASLLPVVPLLGDAMHIDVAETDDTGAIEPRFRRDRLADVVIEVMDLLLDGPALLLVEDAQWMDEASAHLLERIAAATRTRHWRMVVTRRPGEGGFAPPDAAEVVLGPLTPEEATELVIAATAAAPLRPHEIAAIVGRGSGNPLFIEETIRAVRDTGGVTALPDSLGAIVGIRIDALPPLARRVLRYSSVLGRSFRLAALRDLLEGENITIDATTRRDLRGFYERDGRSRLRFRHSMTRDVAYDGLSFRRRRELHLRAASGAEQSAGAAVDEIADLLALHYSLGGDHAKAWHYSRIAGDTAKEAYANVEAARHYERALESARRLDRSSALDRADVWVSLGEAREPIGLFDEALDAYGRASRLLKDHPERRALVQYKRASLRDRAGEYTMALRETAVGYRMLEGDPSKEAAQIRARLAMRRASVRQAQERPREAMRLAEAAAIEARRADERHAEAAACMILHWSYLMLGEPGGSGHGERALELFSELGELEEVAGVTNNLGGEAYLQGRWDDALEYYRRGQDAAQRAGDLMYAALIGSNIGELLVNQGRLDEAEPILRDAARVQRASGWVEGADAAEHYLGRLMFGRGDLTEARALLEQVYDDYTTMGRPAFAVEVGIFLARTLAAAGDTDEARALIDELSPRSDEYGHTDLMILAETELLHRLDRSQEALDLAVDHVATANDDQMTFEFASLVTWAAALADELGSDAVTPEALRRAVAALEHMGVVRHATGSTAQ